MGHVIAISGKGGVGKTTLCGLLIQYLCESGKRPVLAVDADANANLNEVLGVEPEITLGELREEIERAGVDPRYQIPSGMTKQAYLEMRLSDAIAEEDDYDLMVMGRTQGQGCYCFVNGLVQTQDGKLDAGTLEEIRNQGLELLGVVPHDNQVYQYDCDGKPIIQLPKDSPVRSALGEIVKKLGL